MELASPPATGPLLRTCIWPEENASGLPFRAYRFLEPVAPAQNAGRVQNCLQARPATAPQEQEVAAEETDCPAVQRTAMCAARQASALWPCHLYGLERYPLRSDIGHLSEYQRLAWLDAHARELETSSRANQSRLYEIEFSRRNAAVIRSRSASAAWASAVSRARALSDAVGRIHGSPPAATTIAASMGPFELRIWPGQARI